jgi:3-oxoacyl-[acyl-carrier-protein] synthase-1
MRAALADAGCAPDRVGYLNLHGTGTPLNDRMEAAAVHRVFGRGVRASSTKPLVGHTLGAAGATEAAFCWLALSQGEGAVPLPPHLYDGEYDPDLPRIDLCERGEVLESEQALLMSCSYAFGGSCSALILGRDPG